MEIFALCYRQAIQKTSCYTLVPTSIDASQMHNIPSWANGSYAQFSKSQSWVMEKPNLHIVYPDDIHPPWWESNTIQLLEFWMNSNIRKQFYIGISMKTWARENKTYLFLKIILGIYCQRVFSPLCLCVVHLLQEEKLLDHKKRQCRQVVN